MFTYQGQRIYESSDIHPPKSPNVSGYIHLRRIYKRKHEILIKYPSSKNILQKIYPQLEVKTRESSDSDVRRWTELAVRGTWTPPNKKQWTRKTVEEKETQYEFLSKLTPSNSLTLSDTSYELARLRNEIETQKFFIDAIKKGFKPVHWIVFHLHKPKYSYESAKFDATLKDIRNKVFGLLYGSRWRKFKDRARVVGGVELGKYKRRPHINLLIEELPKKFSSKRIDDLFNIQLPKKVKGVWMKDAVIKPYYSDDVTGYMSKEFHHQFPTINTHLTDKF
tara:strand:+ start:164 stop:1000 length:837 start_codon:yes stop_codon:yes gene_type:complete